MRYIALVLALGFLAFNAPALRQHCVDTVFTHKLFKVSRCDAQANLTTSYPVYRLCSGILSVCAAVLLGRPLRLRLLSTAGDYANPTMYIDFTNVTHKVMKDVVWGLVANGRLVAEARDVGTFSPGAEIKHKYGLSQNVFPLQTGLPHCIALRVTFADGTIVRNPNLPRERAQFTCRRRRAQVHPLPRNRRPRATILTLRTKVAQGGDLGRYGRRMSSKTRPT